MLRSSLNQNTGVNANIVSTKSGTPKNKVEFYAAKLADPNYISPGEWHIIHSTAVDAITDEDIKFFIKVMNKIRDKKRCPKCKYHMTEYMKENPFDVYWNITNDKGQRIGMFQWTWKFHNSVNVRTGKEYIDWDTSYAIWYTNTNTICSSQCLEGLPPGFIAKGPSTEENKSEPPGISVTRAINSTNGIYLKGGSNNVQSPQPNPPDTLYKSENKISLKPSIVKNR